jgi:hypothetical protein
MKDTLARSLVKRTTATLFVGFSALAGAVSGNGHVLGQQLAAETMRGSPPGHPAAGVPKTQATGPAPEMAPVEKISGGVIVPRPKKKPPKIGPLPEPPPVIKPTGVASVDELTPFLFARDPLVKQMALDEFAALGPKAVAALPTIERFIATEANIQLGFQGMMVVSAIAPNDQRWTERLQGHLQDPSLKPDDVAGILQQVGRMGGHLKSARPILMNMVKDARLPPVVLESSFWAWAASHPADEPIDPAVQAYAERLLKEKEAEAAALNGQIARLTEAAKEFDKRADELLKDSKFAPAASAQGDALGCRLKALRIELADLPRIEQLTARLRKVLLIQR